MDSKIRKFCKEILKTHYHDVLKTDRKTRQKYWDYPEAASICVLDGAQARGCSQYFRCAKWDWFVRRQIERIGPLGYGRQECLNPLGNCAEQHSCNNLAKRIPVHHGNFADVRFSHTMRPRTMQILPYCRNCKDIFPSLN